MKSGHQEKRVDSRVSKKRWAAYVAAGAATAVGTEASVEAEIVHVVVNQTLADSTPGAGGTFYNYFGLELFGRYTVGGTSQQGFYFLHGFPNTTTNIGFMAANWGSTLYAPGVGVFAGVSIGGYRYLSDVPYGQFVSALTAFTDGDNLGYMAWNPPLYMQFNEPGISYIAFQFDVGNGTQYGWGRLDMSGIDNGNTATFIDYAYGSPGQAIFVGQTIPEPGSLGVLALGAAGLLAWRRRRRETNGLSI